MSYARFGSPMQEFATADEYTEWRNRQSAAIDALDDSDGWGDKVADDLKGSDVYVFLSIGGFLDCCGCSLGSNSGFDSTDAMLAHLQEHREAGHNVPDGCIAGLERDRAENDAEMGAWR